MTPETAKRFGIVAAQEAYRQWNRREHPFKLVMQYCDSLYAKLEAEGLTYDDAELLDIASLCFWLEAEFLFKGRLRVRWQGRDHSRKRTEHPGADGGGAA